MKPNDPLGPFVRRGPYDRYGITRLDRAGAARRGPKLDHETNPLAAILFIGVVGAAILFAAYSIYSDIDAAGVKTSSILPFLLLFVALLIALGFEFVNGFHDTANAVATVIYTQSLPANIAVVWSGMFNLLGVLWSSGAVAFGIVSLLPVELILQVGSSAGFAMVFALLIAAIIWNLGTWRFRARSISSSRACSEHLGESKQGFSQLRSCRMESDTLDLDQMQAAYHAAVEEWIAAIKQEEALASVNHTIAKVDKWEAAHFAEDDIRSKVKAAKKKYEDALREKFFGF